MTYVYVLYMKSKAFLVHSLPPKNHCVVPWGDGTAGCENAWFTVVGSQKL